MLTFRIQAWWFTPIIPGTQEVDHSPRLAPYKSTRVNLKNKLKQKKNWRCGSSGRMLS
jgi:hypothetical protein